MRRPSREQLNALLWSDPASEAFEGDALAVLSGEDRGTRYAQTPLGRVLTVVEDMVGSETEGASLGLEGEDDADDLRDLACGAKRCAILLLHAAFYAEEQAKKFGRRGRS